METYIDHPKGTFSTEMRFELDGDKVEGLTVVNGCNGNLKGIAALVKGMPIDEVIARLDGIRCGFKNTSCPDQMAQGLKAYKASRQ